MASSVVVCLRSSFPVSEQDAQPCHERPRARVTVVVDSVGGRRRIDATVAGDPINVSIEQPHLSIIPSFNYSIHLMSFGSAYGTYIKELRFEQRAVFIVDAEDTVRYAEYVPKIGQYPDYDAALAALKEVVG